MQNLLTCSWGGGNKASGGNKQFWAGRNTLPSRVCSSQGAGRSRSWLHNNTHLASTIPSIFNRETSVVFIQHQHHIFHLGKRLVLKIQAFSAAYSWPQRGSARKILKPPELFLLPPCSLYASTVWKWQCCSLLPLALPGGGTLFWIYSSSRSHGNQGSWKSLLIVFFFALAIL